MREEAWKEAVSRLQEAQEWLTLWDTDQAKRSIGVALAQLRDPRTIAELSTPSAVHKGMRTVAEVMRQPSPLRLPRSTWHAIERDRNHDFEEARLTESLVTQEIREMEDKSASNLEAISAASRDEMKSIHSQLRKLRELQKKMEMNYLYHFHRLEMAQRLMTKVTMVPPGKSAREKETGKEVEDLRKGIEAGLAKMSQEEAEEATKLLKRLGI